MFKLLIFFAILISKPGHATQLFEMGTSVRALGMGNAYVAVVNDSNSMFYNPAALAKVDGYYWTVLDFQVGLSGTDTLAQLANMQDASSMASIVQGLYGKNIWIGSAAKMGITVPYFSFMVYDHIDTSIYVRNAAYPTLDVNVVNDLGYGIGFAFPILPAFHMGMALKRIKRQGIRKKVAGTVTGNLDTDALIAEVKDTIGYGYQLDLGFNITVDAVISPTFSFVWKNIGQTKFSPKKSANPSPPMEAEEMIIGFALTIDTPVVSITPAFDYKHLNASDVQLAKKIHIGVEVDLPIVDIRAGIHQGYYTLGAGMSLGLIRLNAATYGVELGEYPGQKEDRRYIVQVEFELGFSKDGSFLGGSGGGSGSGGRGSGYGRLKRRR